MILLMYKKNTIHRSKLQTYQKKKNGLIENRFGVWILMKKEGRKRGGGVMREDGEGIREKVKGIGMRGGQQGQFTFLGGRIATPRKR